MVTTMTTDNSDAEPSFTELLVKHTPQLRAFAISLSSSPTLADDLVQEALMRAWKNRDKFEKGTNIKAWLLTILRNIYFNQWRRQKRSPITGSEEQLIFASTGEEQSSHMDLLDVGRLLSELPDVQREAILLVANEGLSYEEVAEITGCAVGTVKSRVNRGRTTLAELLERNKAAPSSDLARRTRVA